MSNIAKGKLSLSNEALIIIDPWHGGDVMTSDKLGYIFQEAGSNICAVSANILILLMEITWSTMEEYSYFLKVMAHNGTLIELLVYKAHTRY